MFWLDLEAINQIFSINLAINFYKHQFTHWNIPIDKRDTKALLYYLFGPNDLRNSYKLIIMTFKNQIFMGRMLFEKDSIKTG